MRNTYHLVADLSLFAVYRSPNTCSRLGGCSCSQYRLQNKVPSSENNSDLLQLERNAFVFSCSTRYHSYLRHYATSRKDAGSIPDNVSRFCQMTSFFQLYYGPRIGSLSRILPGSKGRLVPKAGNLTAICGPHYLRKCGSLEVPLTTVYISPACCRDRFYILSAVRIVQFTSLCFVK
jgi:hypothetical protein